MLKTIREFGKCLVIAGFREARIENIEKLLRTVRDGDEARSEAQFFDARLVATWEHLYFAALNALTAFRNGDNISKSLAMETMLYASAQHQIKKATELAGIKPVSTEVALLIIGDRKEDVEASLAKIQKSIEMRPDDSVLEVTEKKATAIKKAFEISDLELETAAGQVSELNKALVSLVIEHMALLVTRR